MRPVLAPAARRLWRDPQTLQLGRGPGRAGVLAGLDPGTRAALGLLDGTRDEVQLLAAAAREGCPPERTRHLLDLLGAAGLLEDGAADVSALSGLERAERDRLAPDLASLGLVRGDGGLPAAQHRAQARVLVLGAGRVGAPLAALLATTGIGSVDVVDDCPAEAGDAVLGGLAVDDAGRRRGSALRERIQVLAPSASTRPLAQADLVVLAPSSPDELDQARLALPPGTPHLLAEVRETLGVVGPLVLPGRTACLQCLDLTRSDLDPCWPALAAQLVSRSRARPSCDAALALMVAGLAAMQVHAAIDATAAPATLGGTLELALPDWRWRRRSWPRHPACACAPPAAMPP